MITVAVIMVPAKFLLVIRRSLGQHPDGRNSRPATSWDAGAPGSMTGSSRSSATWRRVGRSARTPAGRPAGPPERSNRLPVQGRET
jgi:hypothetical protein